MAEVRIVAAQVLRRLVTSEEATSWALNEAMRELRDHDPAAWERIRAELHRRLGAGKTEGP